MSDNLPPLPEPEPTMKAWPAGAPWFNADQMRAYGDACAAAEREACAACLDKASSEYMANATDNKYLTDYGRAIMTSASDLAETMAAAIRARGEECDAGPWGPCPTPSACKCPPRREI